jgi:hypothetical protein
MVKSLSGVIIIVPKERRINVSIKKNAKKVAVIIAVAFLIALAGPVVMSVALGTDSVGVIYAAYQPSLFNAPGSQPGLFNAPGSQPGFSSGSGSQPGLSNAPGSQPQ